MKTLMRLKKSLFVMVITATMWIAALVTPALAHSQVRENAPGVLSAADTVQAPNYCEGIYWEAYSATETRIYAFSDTIRGYLWPEEYGLILVVVHDANRNLLHEGTYNASIYGGADFRVPAARGHHISISLTDDANTHTYCHGSIQRT